MDPRLSVTETPVEKAVLVSVRHGRQPAWISEDALDELSSLAATAGAQVSARVMIAQPAPHAAGYIGRGKAREVAETVAAEQADMVLFDTDLSPAQGRNLEQWIGVKVLDRTQLILDIFALHARSREGRLQVELARLQYLLPRLRRMWTHLERQKGGIGLRAGPGEQQIEMDRRRILERIVRLRREVKGVRRHRAELRRSRRRHEWAQVSLVGYTNAGKSTLLNRLTGAQVAARDQLFVTLDPTTRRIDLPNHQSVLLSDTVGFIRDLPHHLVEAFKATLEEVAEADLLVHVIDAAHERVEQQMAAVTRVLQEIGSADKPVLSVLNKIDLPAAAQRWPLLAREHGPAVALSARSGEGLDRFLDALADCVRSRFVDVCACLPLKEGRLMAQVRAGGRILHEESTAAGWQIRARLPPRLAGLLAPYRREGFEKGVATRSAEDADEDHG